MAGDTGKFSANISEQVIEEALKSVARRTEGSPTEIPIEVEPSAPKAAEAAAPEAGEAQNAELELLKTQLEFSMAKGRELMERMKEDHEKMLRAVADLENYRKRAAKEKDEVQRFGSERLLKDLLPVVDNLDRALEHSKSATDLESFRTGVGMTRKLFEDVLGRHGIKCFSAVGQAFDPHLHEAMQQVETSEMPANQVVAEILRGYLLNERLVRPAMVMVSKAPTQSDESKPGEQPRGGSAPDPAAGG